MPLALSDKGPSLSGIWAVGPRRQFRRVYAGLVVTLLPPGRLAVRGVGAIEAAPDRRFPTSDAPGPAAPSPWGPTTRSSRRAPGSGTPTAEASRLSDGRRRGRLAAWPPPGRRMEVERRARARLAARHDPRRLVDPQAPRPAGRALAVRASQPAAGAPAGRAPGPAGRPGPRGRRRPPTVGSHSAPP